jgi:hypothetical protein
VSVQPANIENKLLENSDLTNLNQNLVNFNELDIHDFALFKNFSLLHPLEADFNYELDGSTNSNPISNKTVALTDWLKSIEETRVGFNSECLARNSDCSCISNHLSQEKALESVLVRFFIDKLNGNSFKLKHLYSVLGSFLKDGIKEAEHLRASVEFLNTPCAVNLFKAAVFIHNHKSQNKHEQELIDYDENFNVISSK